MNDEAYIRLRKELKIDLMSIDEQLIQLPMLQMDAAEEASKAVAMQEAAEADYKTVIAEADGHIRSSSDKKPPEEAIKQQIILDPMVVRHSQEAADARLDAALWKSLVSAFRTKSDALQKLADLMLAGYLSPNSVRRKQIQEVRESLPTRERL